MNVIMNGSWEPFGYHLSLQTHIMEIKMCKCDACVCGNRTHSYWVWIAKNEKRKKKKVALFKCVRVGSNAFLTIFLLCA